MFYLILDLFKAGDKNNYWYDNDETTSRTTIGKKRESSKYII